MAKPYIQVSPYLMDLSQLYTFVTCPQSTEAPTDNFDLVNKQALDNAIAAATPAAEKPQVQGFITTVLGDAQQIAGLDAELSNLSDRMIFVGVSPIAIIENEEPHYSGSEVRTVKISSDGTNTTLNFNASIDAGETIFYNLRKNS